VSFFSLVSFIYRNVLSFIHFISICFSISIPTYLCLYFKHTYCSDFM